MLWRLNLVFDDFILSHTVQDNIMNTYNTESDVTGRRSRLYKDTIEGGVGKATSDQVTPGRIYLFF